MDRTEQADVQKPAQKGPVAGIKKRRTEMELRFSTVNLSVGAKKRVLPFLNLFRIRDWHLVQPNRKHYNEYVRFKAL